MHRAYQERAEASKSAAKVAPASNDALYVN
jgi:hypothetical protein